MSSRGTASTPIAGNDVPGEFHIVREENAVEGHGIHVEESHEGGRVDPVLFYGPWAWIGGLVFAAAMIWLMFGVSDPI